MKKRAAALRKDLNARLSEFEAGTVRKFRVVGSEGILGEPLQFTRENVAPFNL